MRRQIAIARKALAAAAAPPTTSIKEELERLFRMQPDLDRIARLGGALALIETAELLHRYPYIVEWTEAQTYRLTHPEEPSCEVNQPTPPT